MVTLKQINSKIKRLNKSWRSLKIGNEDRPRIIAKMEELEQLRKTLKPVSQVNPNKKRNKFRTKTKRGRLRTGEKAWQHHHESNRYQEHGLILNISDTKVYEEKVDALLQELRNINTNVKDETDRSSIINKLKLYR